jgi:leucyl aminopeptidase
MMRIVRAEKPIHEQSHAFFVHEKQEIPLILKHAFHAVPEIMTAFLAREEFSGQAGKVISLPHTHDGNLLNVFFIGFGKPDHTGHHSIEAFRRGLGSLIKTMQKRKLSVCTLHVPNSDLFGVSDEYLAKQIAIISSVACYHFDYYISDVTRKVIQDLTLNLSWPECKAQEVDKGIREGLIISEALNKVRHWIDLPPSDLTPPHLVEKAQEIAKQYGLKITAFDEAAINKMGMGGLSAVSVGSEVDAAFVILEYKTSVANAPTLAFVGKGITFDSGGLSIKPAQSMENMKDDMSGAAAVMGAMQAIAQLKPAVNVIGITPLSENLPSGSALKPGDIIRFYNGKTAEVRNTDAEGRLILADALSYAVKHYKPDAMIDIATLTGACAYALGPFFTGMMGKNEALLKKIEKAADKAGERVWQLPFDDDYKKAIISDVADICNIGKPNYMAGAITAGFFLSHFVEDTPWVHMDIAGTAFNVPDISYYNPGATGSMMRTLVELAMHWEKL